MHCSSAWRKKASVSILSARTKATDASHGYTILTATRSSFGNRSTQQNNQRMDKIKIILITIAVILGSLGLLALVGLVSALIQSLFWIGLLVLAGYIGV